MTKAEKKRLKVKLEQLIRELSGKCTYCPAPATSGKCCAWCRISKREAWRRWRAKNPKQALSKPCST